MLEETLSGRFPQGGTNLARLRVGGTTWVSPGGNGSQARQGTDGAAAGDGELFGTAII